MKRVAERTAIHSKPFNKQRETLPESQSGRRVILATHCHLVTKSITTHSIRLHSETFREKRDILEAPRTVASTTKFLTMAPNIFSTVTAGVNYDEHSMKRQLTAMLNCGSSVCNLLHLPFWRLEFRGS